MLQTTVREAIELSAVLRLQHTRDQATIQSFVDSVMALVELTTQKDSLVGAPGLFGLSLEQRKRLTIAVELVANPSIIFMDEPTSGLDARAAAIVMRAVRNTVNTGRTVVCTIHQPSIDIFEVNDQKCQYSTEWAQPALHVISIPVFVVEMDIIFILSCTHVIIYQSTCISI